MWARPLCKAPLRSHTFRGTILLMAQVDTLTHILI